MEKAKEYLELTEEESGTVSRVTILPHRVGVEASFYDDFTLRGIRVDRVEPDLVSCTFKVPPCLTDKNGNLANGAIANLIDVVGSSVVHADGHPLKVTVDMSISFVSTAKHYDELEVTSMVLGQRGGYSGTIVLIRNKARERSLLRDEIHCLIDNIARSNLCVVCEWKSHPHTSVSIICGHWFSF